VIRYINANPSNLSYIAVQTDPRRAVSEECLSWQERFYRMACILIGGIILGLIITAGGTVTGFVLAVMAAW